MQYVRGTEMCYASLGRETCICARSPKGFEDSERSAREERKPNRQELDMGAQERLRIWILPKMRSHSAGTLPSVAGTPLLPCP